MRNAFLDTVAGWLGAHMRDAAVDAADAAAYGAWLSSDYQPLSGGWQY